MELKIKIGKKGIITGLILLILLAVYNVLYFAIPFDRSHSNGAFWLTYGFTTFFIIFMAVVVFIGFHDKDIKSRVMGIPVIYLGYSILCIQFVIDAVVMGVGNFFEIKTWIPVIVEVLLLAFFLISLIARTAYKDTIAKIDSQKQRKAYITELRIQLESMLNSVTNEEVKKELEKLCETVKYTDPVSYKEVEDIEDEISNNVEKLKVVIGDGDSVKVNELIKSISNLVNERKLRLKARR